MAPWMARGYDVRWSSAGHRTGAYIVKVRVENGRHGSADCSVSIRVDPRPNRIPTISCAADRSTVTVGETAAITATASDPDNDPLTFSWSSRGGRIEGSDASVKFTPAVIAPGALYHFGACRRFAWRHGGLHRERAGGSGTHSGGSNRVGSAARAAQYLLRDGASDGRAIPRADWWRASRMYCSHWHAISAAT